MDRKPQRAQYMICACIAVREDDRSEFFVFAGDRDIDLRQIEPSDIPVNGKPDGCLFTVSRKHAGTDRLQLQNTRQQCVIVFTRVLHNDDRIEAERASNPEFQELCRFLFPVSGLLQMCLLLPMFRTIRFPFRSPLI